MIKRIFSEKIKPFLQQGLAPRALAISMSAGCVIGLFPVPGIATWAIALIALRFRLNLAIMMIASYLIWPLQLLLIIPFIRLGEWIWQIPAIPLTLESIEATFHKGFLFALQDLWQANLCAAGAWLIVCLPLGMFMYGVWLPVFRFLRKQYVVQSVEI